MGETLIEVLIAVALMGIAFSTILGGMITSSRIARMNQEATRANQVLSAAADRLLDPIATKYLPCAAANNGSLNDNNGNDEWYYAWQYGLDGAAGSKWAYVPSSPDRLLPDTWRVRITNIRYLLGPDVRNRPPNVSFELNGAGGGDPDGNPMVPKWSDWGAGSGGWGRCLDLRSMYPTTPGALRRDGGLQQIKIAVEKPDGGGAHGYLTVDEITVTKRDQRCPATNYSNADRGPC
jgi:type II secretory pathway pseudopilin PulG